MLQHAAGSLRIEKNTAWREGRRDDGGGGGREGEGESVRKSTERKRVERESDAERKYRRGVQS